MLSGEESAGYLREFGEDAAHGINRIAEEVAYI